MLRLWAVHREDTRHALALIRASHEAAALALARAEFGDDVSVRLARNARAPRGFRLLDQSADGHWPDQLRGTIPFPW